MKHFTLYTLLFLILSTSMVYGQWTAQDAGTTSHLRGVDFINPQIGVATGHEGKIIRTTDGGASWTEISNDNFGVQWSVRFINETTGWIMGESGVLLFSNDQGATWQQQTINSTQYFHAIDAIDDNKIWLGGYDGALYYTEDQGATWQDKSSALELSDGITDIEFFSETEGIIFGLNGLMKKTTDGGASWTTINATTLHIANASFIDETTGWICGQGGHIHKTTDGGNTWVAQQSNTLEYIQDVYFLNANRGYAAGRSGTLLVTEDGGQTWTSDTHPTLDHLIKLAFIDDAHGWAVGSNGVILTTMVPTSTESQLIPEADVSLFPNPMSTQAMVTIPADAHIEHLAVVDANGKTLRQYPLGHRRGHTFTFNRDGLPSGMYFLQIITQGQMIVKKLIIR